MDGSESTGRNGEKNGALSQMMEDGDFKISAVTNNIDLTRFRKPELSPAQKMQVSALLQQLPSALAAGTMASAYRIEFPKGVVGTLTKLKQGGYSTAIKGLDKRFAGTASLYSMSMEAAVLGAFTAMSVVTGQFFLARINAELKVINEKLDQILQFLAEDKKAELISEISFVKYASENYSSIMSHDEQRIATIYGLQEARKVAMKDVQFYLNSLEGLGKKVGSKKSEEITKATEDALHIWGSLDSSIQLYVMGSLLEIYYAQNFDADYVDYMNEDLNNYVEMCKSNMLPSFAHIRKSIDEYKRANPAFVKKPEFVECTQKFVDVDEALKTYGSDYRKYMQETMQSLGQGSEYYFTDEGDVYFKAS